MSGSCVRMVKSSAYVVMIVLSVVGWGISAVKRLKRQGERPFHDSLSLADYAISNGVQIDLELNTGD